MNNEEKILEILMRMQEDISGLKAGQAQMQTRFDQMETRFGQMETRFDQMETRFDQMETRFGQMETRFDQMETRFDQMETRFGQMETRIDKIEARIDKIEARIDKIEARIDKIEARIDQMQAKQDEMGEDLHRVKLYLELDVEQRFDAINEGIDSILEKMVPEDRMEKAEDEIIVLKSSVRVLAHDVAELKKAE